VSRPRIAITLGDPRGIGAEITRKALQDDAVRGAAAYVVVGAESAGWPALAAIGRWRGDRDGAAEAGRIAALSIEHAVRLALAGEVDAIVTAPIEKHALHLAGWRFPGHTEMLQSLTGAATVGMMMAAERTVSGPPLRVVLATTHLALREVPARLSVGLLVEQATLTAAALRRWWGVADPRVALCAVNPHASDGGLFGDEEARILVPALARLADAGIGASGPVPADTVFVRAIAGEFDAVIAPYHDVGMAAFKTAAFGSGVNVTLGLPFPRTSPDHGTALDIAGRGLARADSMIEAIRLAARLAAKL
jgi:4-hydroxythreonine-4-phosphate dehydrogenase